MVFLVSYVYCMSCLLPDALYNFCMVLLFHVKLNFGEPWAYLVNSFLCSHSVQSCLCMFVCTFSYIQFYFGNCCILCVVFFSHPSTSVCLQCSVCLHLFNVVSCQLCVPRLCIPSASRPTQSSLVLYSLTHSLVLDFIYSSDFPAPVRV